MDCLSCASSNSDKDFIFETKYWRVFLAEEQEYLGRCLIDHQKHKEHLSELSAEEWTDFGELVMKLETALKKSFGVEMFNWTCLMNNAYQNSPPNPHIHWHLRPRYKNPVEFTGVEFTDPDFGHHYDRERRGSIEERVFSLILEKIKSNI